ncbi:MAG TPA: hypothetical protein VFI03_06040 [Solirubrobacterales bacterium]|nr:hypothetical protein [Solirubrobacterales bacterium]
MEKPFDRTRDPAWAAAVNSWQWKLRGEGEDDDEDGDETSSKSGPCQRCGHAITFVDATAIYSGFRAREPVAAAGRRYAACNCGVAHPETPEGETGCGANGLIDRA